MASINQIIDENETLYGKVLNLDVVADNDDGIFSVRKWTNLCKRIDDHGITKLIEFWYSKNFKPVVMDGYTISFLDKYGAAKIVFDEPITVCFGKVGDKEIISEVKEVIGEIAFEGYFTNSQRKHNYINAIEIFFNIKEFN